VVPLPDAAIAIIQLQPRRLGVDFVFAGRTGKPMSGWSQRMRDMRTAAEAEGQPVPSFTLHDCRRTFRSGLSRLGVDSDLAEMMLNHARADLIERYDREPRAAERAAAAARWAEHVAGVVGTAPDRGNVVALTQRRS
jgi:integrase